MTSDRGEDEKEVIRLAIQLVAQGYEHSRLRNAVGKLMKHPQYRDDPSIYHEGLVANYVIPSKEAN